MSAKIINLFEHHDTAAKNGIDQKREQIIRGQARNLLVRAWRAEAKRGEVELSRILPIEPRWVLSRVFPSWQFVDYRKSLSNGREVGVLDRLTKTIQVNVSLPPTVRRFTGAHELGHLMLHKFRSLRESPFGNDNWRSVNRPEEQEANLFAAELLMPTRYVRKLFLSRFGSALYRDSLDDKTAFYCSGGGNFRASDFQNMTLLDMAKVIAEADSLWTADSRPFTQIFGVSATAMAIQLMDSGLVGLKP
jgi:Zn-dependent peptidase ImmA (M78 family)